jgi:hypothetical protein
LNTGENGGGKEGNARHWLTELNWPTLALILITGGGNLLTTQQAASLNHAEIERAIEEIHKIFLNQERREEAYHQIDESNRILKELQARKP